MMARAPTLPPVTKPKPEVHTTRSPRSAQRGPGTIKTAPAREQIHPIPRPLPKAVTPPLSIREYQTSLSHADAPAPQD